MISHFSYSIFGAEPEPTMPHFAGSKLSAHGSGRERSDGVEFSSNGSSTSAHLILIADVSNTFH